jgi:hypothetical protein
VSLALVAAVLLLLLALAPASTGFFRRNLRHLRTAMALGAAPLLIILGIWGAAAGGRFGDVKMSVLEVALGRSVLQTEGLSIGGTDRDDVITPGQPGGLMRIVRGDDGRIVVRALLASAPATETHLGLIELAGKDGSRFLGAQPFGPGDEVCLTDCASPASLRYRLSADKARLEVVGHPEMQLPTLWSRKALGIGGLIFWKATARIYPMRDFARPQVPGGEIDQDPCKRRWLCEADQPVRSFLFHDGSAALWLVLLDPGAQLTTGGHTVTAPAEADVAAWPATLTSAEVKLHLWRVDMTGPEVDLADENERASRIDGGRALTIALSPDAVSTRLDPAPYRAIEASELIGSGGIVTLPVVGPSPDGSTPVATAAIAPGVGGEAGSAVSLALALPTGQSADSFEALGGAAPRLLRFGADFDVGAIVHGEGAKLVMRLDRLSIPWPMILVSLVWAALLGLSLRNAFLEDRRALMLFGALQLLLALRWLIAIDGAHLDFAADWPLLMRESALAYVASPALLAVGYAALRPSASLGRGERTWEAPLAIVLFVGAMLGAFTPPADFWTAAREAALPAVCIAAALASIVAGAFPRPRKLAAAEAPVAKPAPLQWLSGRERLCGGFVLIVVLARILAALGGFKERLAGIPISLVYLPLALAGLAAFIYATRERRSAVTAIAFGLLLLAAFVVAPGSVSDWGFCIFGFAAAFWVLPRGIELWKAKAPIAGSLWIAPSAVIGLAALAICIAPLLGSARLTGEVAHAADLSDAQAVALLGQLTIRDPNAMRVWAITDPGRIDASGADLAEQHRAWSASLTDYTGSLEGKGLMAQSRLPAALTADHMDDNVSAVHLMAPFGRLGAAALLLLLFAQARWAAPQPAAPQPNAPHDAASARGTLGLLVLWTVFAAAAYMVLDNLQLLPFTGKNIYFLSPASTGDLWEGTVMFGLGLFAVTERAP